MKPVDHISEELKLTGATLLSSISRQSPFAVPAGYFSQLTTELSLLAPLQDEAEPLLSWSRKLPYQVPAAYFELLPDHIMAAIHAGIPAGQNTPFEVPQGYFENFSAGILARVKAEETPETITAAPAPQQKPRKIPLFRNLQLAASVALILFAGFGLLRINNNVSSLTTPNTASINLTGISDDAIKDYVMQNIDDFDTDLIVSSISTGSDARLDAAMGTSNEEIEAYLNEDGWN